MMPSFRDSQKQFILQLVTKINLWRGRIFGMARRVSLCQNVAKSCRIGTALTRLDVLCIWNKAFVFFPCSQFDFTRIRVYIVLRIGSINTTPGGKDNGKSQAFLERVVFPWLSYNDFSLSVTKKMPTTFIYTMNATEEYLPELEPQLGISRTSFLSVSGLLNALSPATRRRSWTTADTKWRRLRRARRNTANNIGNRTCKRRTKRGNEWCNELDHKPPESF